MLLNPLKTQETKINLQGFVITQIIMVFSSVLLASDPSYGRKNLNFEAEPRLLILDPINLQTDSIDIELGEELRSSFSKMPYWNVVTTQEFAHKLTEINGSTNISCDNFSCAREAGDVVQSDYTIFTTFAFIENLYVYAMNCLSTKTSQVVWTEVGEYEVHSFDNGKHAFLSYLYQTIQSFSPNIFDEKTNQLSESYAVIDGSPNTFHAKVLSDRVMFHTYSLKSHKTVDRNEVKFTLEALGIEPHNLEATEKMIVPIGEDLGVRYVVVADLDTANYNFTLDLSLFDIHQKKKIRTWSHHSSDYKKILRWEEVFFLNLTKRVLSPSEDQITKSTSFPWRRLLTPILLIGLGIGGLVIYNNYN